MIKFVHENEFDVEHFALRTESALQYDCKTSGALNALSIFIHSHIDNPTMPRRKKAEESQGMVQPSNCTKNSKSVADNSVDTNKPVADNIDYERLAQETVKLQKTILEKVTDLPTNPDVPIEHLSGNVQADTSAAHTRNETTQANPIASV